MAFRLPSTATIRVAFSAFALLALAYCFAAIATREYTSAGGAAVYCVLVAAVLPIITATRYVLTTATLIVSILTLLDGIDRQKLTEMKLHISYRDASIIGQFIGEGNFAFFAQYQSVVLPILVGIFITLAFVAAVAFSEHRLPTSTIKLGILPSSALAVFSVLAVNQFIDSEYMHAVKSQIVPRVAADRSPLRMSASLAELSEGIALSSTLRDDRRDNPRAKSVPASTQCAHCPDIIIVHLESVYDPRLEKSFSTMPPFVELAALPGLDRWGSAMEVHTWGGNSVVTEFEILCSLRHELFGWGGLHPHATVAPYLSGCLGNELLRRGYKTSVLYSLNGSFSGVKSAFKNYGISTFEDFMSLKLPKKWSDLHDSLIYNRLTERLNMARSAPRFVWVSTNWNHGPHGLSAIEPLYSGPYKVTEAESAPLRDYVNRLNDTITALKSLQEYVRTTPYSTVIVAYGDHHPAFPKFFTKETAASYENPDYITPVMMVRNFRGPSVPAKSIIRTEDVAYYLSQFAGIAPLASVERIHMIQSTCAAGQPSCSRESQSALRAVQVR